MRAHVELAHALDPVRWRSQHAAGLVPDALPFGLDVLERHGVALDLRPLTRRPGRVARRLDRTCEDLQFVESLTTSAHRRRRSCDVVLGWDEWTGVPAGWRSAAPGEPPSVSGVMNLTDWPHLSRPVRRVLQGGLRRNRALFVHNRRQAALLVDEWGIPSDRVHVVPFGVDPTFFHPCDEPVDGDLVLSVGDDAHRDYATLVSAFRKVATARPATRMHVATSHPLPTGVPGLTSDSRKLGSSRPRVYSAAGVVAVAALPNDHGSGLSVVVEAMACGRPWVATSSRGFDDHFGDGDGGILVAPADVHGMAAAIRRLLDDPDEATALGRVGRAIVEARLNTARQGAAVAELLHEVVG
jgi:glycosyltransferase involved in cell wall biosynthesis